VRGQNCSRHSYFYLSRQFDLLQQQQKKKGKFNLFYVHCVKPAPLKFISLKKIKCREYPPHLQACLNATITWKPPQPQMPQRPPPCFTVLGPTPSANCVARGRGLRSQTGPVEFSPSTTTLQVGAVVGSMLGRAPPRTHVRMSVVTIRPGNLAAMAGAAVLAPHHRRR
jgi:hypothetical protein